MSESSSTQARAPHEATEDDGWYLDKSSWAFHRSAFRILGHPLAFGEYGHLRRQISSGQAELLRFGQEGGLYRARLRDGTVLDVLARTGKAKGQGNKVWYALTQAMRPAGKPRAVPPSAPPPAPAPAIRVSSPVPPAPAPLPPEPIRRPSTLTLGTSARTAVELLAARLQPKPPPPRLESGPAQKPRTQARR